MEKEEFEERLAKLERRIQKVEEEIAWLYGEHISWITNRE